jgi:hypothetical protein
MQVGLVGAEIGWQRIVPNDQIVAMHMAQVDECSIPRLEEIVQMRFDDAGDLVALMAAEAHDRLPIWDFGF